MEKLTRYCGNKTRLFVYAALSALVTLFALSVPGSATGIMSKADLQGYWQMTIVGQTSGCGIGSTLYTFTLDANGVATNVTAVSHSQGCGDVTTTGNSFTVTSLNANGSGNANLTCGVGCGWNLRMQVSPDRTMFNVVDVSSANPGNFIEGIAIHQ